MSAVSGSPAPAPREPAGLDPQDPGRALGVDGLLGAFNGSGVLLAADVRVAELLGRLGDEPGEEVKLAAALAVRATRLGSVLVDLASISTTAAVETEQPVDLESLPWPSTGPWIERVQRSPLTGGEEASDQRRPLRLEGSRLYLDRLWRDECAVAADLLALDVSLEPEVDLELLGRGIRRLFGQEQDTSQRRAAAAAVLNRLSVIAGGPGTGKTSTVSRVITLLAEQAAAAGRGAPLVALAAPTGKAANRLQEAVRADAAELDLAGPEREMLTELTATTLHRLLGPRPSTSTRFRHHRANRLPHDVIVIDETSMVALPQMARLLEAVRPDARLVLVGDPGQLASIEAGAVLGDVVGDDPERGGGDLGDSPPPGSAGRRRFGQGIVVLDRVHRFGEGIARAAEAVRRGDADALIEVLGARHPDVLWLSVDAGEGTEPLAPLRDQSVAAVRVLLETARTGDAPAALTAVRSHMVLCAHRRGPYGVSGVTQRILGWLSTELRDFDPTGDWFVGQPLLVTRNDYDTGLLNGDIGVVVDRDGHLSAEFERQGDPASFTPTRLGTAETVYAMTIHKSQGSQFSSVAVLVPPPDSRILTRELLYTAITRATSRLLVIGTEAMLRAAIERPVARGSGLRERLWGSV